MPQFRIISYPKMIYETLRNYMSVTKVYFDSNGVKHGGVLSILYRYTLCCIWPLQDKLDSFDTWRNKKQIIANCKWTLGQVVNVLNYLYDNSLKRIYISQQTIVALFAPTLNYESTTFAPTLNYESTTFAPQITDDVTIKSETVIHIPASLYSDTLILTDMISTIEQIRIYGLTYQIIAI